MHTEKRILILQLEQAWAPGSWHGTGLKGAVRGITAEEALWRPGRGRHNIWELVLHMAYWKYVVSRRINRAERGSFPREGSNWIPVSDPSPEAWKADIRLLYDQHALLKEAVNTLPAGRLHDRNGSRWTHAEQIAGAAAHDLYHTGQVQLIKKLRRPRSAA